MKLLKPQRPHKGDIIDVISPASCPKSTKKYHQGCKYLEELGFQVRQGEHVLDKRKYLAGEDADRFKDLKSAFESPSKAIINSRGGYGCARLIRPMDDLTVPADPKVFMGYSDITAIHSYLMSRWNWVSYYGPMVAVEFGSDDFEGSYTDRYFRQFLFENPDEFLVPDLPYIDMEGMLPGEGEGQLVGGCLALVLDTLGTHYEMDFQDKILFLEEVREWPYQFDRALMTLAISGVFDKVKGVVIGEIMQEEESLNEVPLKDIAYEILKPYNIPLIVNAPFGHGDDKVIFPVGVRAHIDGNNANIRFLEKIWED